MTKSAKPTNQKKHEVECETANQIIWEDGTIPRALKFDDTYYSKADGLRETQYVFIRGNKLIERWKDMKNCIIGELGFGTGLNFLTTVIEWQKHRPPHSKLKFVSFEQYPLSPTEIEKALSRWPQLNQLCKQLIEALKKFDHADTQKIFITFSQDIDLEINIGDANLTLTNLDIKADAWYLDGFSPAKNPELWNDELMERIANKTAKNGTFATFTAAGKIRKSLEIAGFDVTREKGFDGKRHMSIGTLRQA